MPINQEVTRIPKTDQTLEKPYTEKDESLICNEFEKKIETKMISLINQVNSLESMLQATKNELFRLENSIIKDA